MGPVILARTMSVATLRGAASRAWQYHSRSDSHSKVACWTVLFDLLVGCDAIRRLATEGRLGFRINHVMVGPLNKTLDLVLTLSDPTRQRGHRATFADMVGRYGIQLDRVERSILESLPVLMEDLPDEVAEVAVAVEAKACMTEHVKSIPRLHAEILATGYLARLATRRCITVSYNLVNASSSFVSPARGGGITSHKLQDAAQVIDMLRRAVPLARNVEFGYDVIGVTVVDCANDGSPVVVRQDPPAPTTADHLHYDRMLVSLCSEFRSRFSR